MTDDKELEARLRETFVARDPRSAAPSALVERVALVTVSPPRPRLQILARPALSAGVLFMTAAAAVAGVIIIGSFRGVGTTGAPAPSAGTSTAPNATPDLHIVGFVLSLPIVLVIGLAVGIVAATAVILEPTSFSVPGLVARPPRGFAWLARSVPRRLVFIGVVIALIAAGFAASGIDALGSGSTWAPAAPHFMGSTQGIGPNRGIAFFRGGSGGTIAFAQAIRNDSQVPVTVLGDDHTMPWLELRLFAEAYPQEIGDPNTSTSYPFAPFELGPGDERQILFVMHLSKCGYVDPAPSPEPTADPGSDFVPPTGGGEQSIDDVTLRYSILGLERTGVIEFDPVPILWSAGSGSCGFDPDWASPSPR